MKRDLRAAVEDVAEFALRAPWGKMLEIDHGACIPIAVYTAEFLTALGFPARPVEAGARFVDPQANRYAEMDSPFTQGGLTAEDVPGEAFIGHLITFVPTRLTLLDFSLSTQTFETLKGHIPDVVMATVKRGDVGFRIPLDHGHAIYRFYPRRDGWKYRQWPFAEIRNKARKEAEWLSRRSR